MIASFRLSDADREQFGGPEWVSIDTDTLADLDYDQLAALEKTIRRHDHTSIARIVAIEWPDSTMLGIRGMAWLARQLAGLEKPDWPDFKPHILGAIQESGSHDADPPAAGSSEPSSDKPSQASTGRSKKASPS